jgi:hypothetical protein
LTVSCIYRKLKFVRRAASCLLLLTFLLIGSGALEYIHNWAHELEDRINDRSEAMLSQSAGIDPHANPGHQEHHHDESNCEVHAQLHMAIIAYGWTALLIWLGIWIAFLTLLAIPLIPRLLPVRIDCRGPPAWVHSISI